MVIRMGDGGARDGGEEGGVFQQRGEVGLGAGESWVKVSRRRGGGSGGVGGRGEERERGGEDEDAEEGGCDLSR